MIAHLLGGPLDTLIQTIPGDRANPPREIWVDGHRYIYGVNDARRGEQVPVFYWHEGLTGNLPAPRRAP